MLIDWTSIPSAPGMREGSTRQAIAGNYLSAVRVLTDTSAVFDGRVHTHDNEQLLIVVSGFVELQIGESHFVANEGDLVVFPSGAAHAAVGVGPEGCEYYEVFAPPRYDQFPGWFGASPLKYI